MLPKTRIKARPTVTGNLTNGPTRVVYDGSNDTLLASQGHPKINGVYRSGGTFYKYGIQLSFDKGFPFTGLIRNSVYYGDYLAKGIAFGSMDVRTLTPPWLPSIGEVDTQLKAQYSAKGYARTRPGNPVATAGQFLIELRDLPSMLPLSIFRGPFQGIPKRAKRFVAEAMKIPGQNQGNLHLLWQFGWKPFIRDLQRMYFLWQTMDKHLAKLVRENGKNIRRQASLESQDTYVIDDRGAYGFPGAYVNGFPGEIITVGNGSSSYLSWKRTSVKAWYVASYQYYMPDIGSSQWTTAAKRALFGINPTPELIWNVLPWSWLTDWFVNVGDVISNISENAVQNLRQNYSYIMVKSSTTTNWSTISKWSGLSNGPPFVHRWAPGSFTWFTETIRETKVRVGGGSPYQLSPIIGDLTADQWGIAAALGLSKVHLR